MRAIISRGILYNAHGRGRIRIGPEGRDQAVPMHLGLTYRPFVPLVTVISALIHLWWQSRATRRESHLLAKEGTVLTNSAAGPPMSRDQKDLLYAPKLGHGTDYLTSPP
jgi:hypothetical protein